MGASPLSLEPGAKGVTNVMNLETMIAPPAAPCRCTVCVARRATQLAQALQNKFGRGFGVSEPKDANLVFFRKKSLFAISVTPQ
jgi:hypothetical protein